MWCENLTLNTNHVDSRWQAVILDQSFATCFFLCSSCLSENEIIQQLRHFFFFCSYVTMCIFASCVFCVTAAVAEAQLVAASVSAGSSFVAPLPGSAAAGLPAAPHG